MIFLLIINFANTELIFGTNYVFSFASDFVPDKDCYN